jgi:hypothetical protein
MIFGRKGRERFPAAVEGFEAAVRDLDQSRSQQGERGRGGREETGRWFARAGPAKS